MIEELLRSSYVEILKLQHAAKRELKGHDLEVARNITDYLLRDTRFLASTLGYWQLNQELKEMK